METRQKGPVEFDDGNPKEIDDDLVCN